MLSIIGALIVFFWILPVVVAIFGAILILIAEKVCHWLTQIEENLK